MKKSELKQLIKEVIIKEDLYNQQERIEKFLTNNFYIDDDTETLLIKKNGKDIELVSRTNAAKGEFEDAAEQWINELKDNFDIIYRIVYCGQKGFRLSAE